MQKLNKHTMIYSLIFSLIAMSAIVFLSANKKVTISDTEHSAQEQLQSHEKESVQTSENYELPMQETANENYLTIPVPENCKAENVTVENHYMDRELCVQIAESKESFFQENPISGSSKRVIWGRSEESGKGVRLSFKVDGIYEYKTVLENNNLYITFLKPKEEYSQIIVIDPACGGMDTGKVSNNVVEKDVVLKVAQKVQEQLEKEGIKAYFTRISDVNPSESARVELANEIGADMFIRIQVGAYEDESIYGVATIFNENYFIPGFGNVELADSLEREVVTSIKGKAIGLERAGETDDTLRNITVPAAAINIGCVTNKQEAILLQRDDYQDKIASGIVNAIRNSSKEIEQ